MLKPKARFDKVTDIDVKFLKEKKIKAVILDVDNTLIDFGKKPLKNVEKWIENLKKADIKICIASNSIKKKKVEKVAKKLDVPYIYFSTKPLKRGLKKAQKILSVESRYIAEIGDQLFTDVLGANRMKMFSILTTPLSPEKNILGEMKRKVENIFLKRLCKTKEN